MLVKQIIFKGELRYSPCRPNFRRRTKVRVLRGLVFARMNRRYSCYRLQLRPGRFMSLPFSTCNFWFALHSALSRTVNSVGDFRSALPTPPTNWKLGHRPRGQDSVGDEKLGIYRSRAALSLPLAPSSVRHSPLSTRKVRNLNTRISSKISSTDRLSTCTR